MTRDSTKIVLLSLLLAVSAQQTALAAGPFGVEMGAPISSLPGCVPSGDDGSYKCSTLPKPHSAFEAYVVVAHPSTGICKVAGIGKDITESGHGISVKAAVDSIAGQIKETYGEPTNRYDFLTAGSIWKEPQEWLMAVHKEQRVYAFAWAKGDGFVGRNNARSVMLQAKALSSEVGYVLLQFEFDNFDACKKALTTKDRAAF